MIQLLSVSKQYGEKILFEAADWLIGPGDRIGLLGANGSGKTTLNRELQGLYAGWEELQQGLQAAQPAGAEAPEI